MFNILCDALSLLFIVSGIFFIISLIFIKLISFDNKEGFSVVLKGMAEDEELYSKIYAAYLEANMFNLVKVNRIIVLDYGVSERMKEDCLSLFENSNILSFVKCENCEALAENICEKAEDNIF